MRIIFALYFVTTEPHPWPAIRRCK